MVFIIHAEYNPKSNDLIGLRGECVYMVHLRYVILSYTIENGLHRPVRGHA